MPKAKDNMKLKSILFPPELLNRIKKAAERSTMDVSKWIRLSATEKLMRTSVEENLDIEVDTDDLKKVMIDFQEKSDKQLLLLKDQQESFEQRIAYQNNEVLDKLDKLMFLVLKFDTESHSSNLAEPGQSLKLKILSMLPTTEEKILIKFDDPVKVQEVLEELKNSGQIKFNRSSNLWVI